MQNRASGFTKLRRYLLDKTVLRPSTNRLECGNQQRHEIRIGKQRIEYFSQPFGHRSANTTDLVILKFPGTAGRAERSTAFPGNLLAGVSGTVLTWNPPGYGRSSGPASMVSIAETAQVFFSEVVQRHAANARVWLCGNSLGCSVALSLSAADSVATIHGVVLRNPPPLVRVVKRVAEKYPLGKWMDPVAESLISEMNAEITASLSTTPAVFLQSMADSLVPPHLQDQLIARYCGPRLVVPLRGLQHDGQLTDQHRDEVRVALDWLWRQSIDQPSTSVTSQGHR